MCFGAMTLNSKHLPEICYFGNASNVGLKLNSAMINAGHGKDCVPGMIRFKGMRQCTEIKGARLEYLGRLIICFQVL